MKTRILAMGIVLFLAGFSNALGQRTYSTIVSEGVTNTTFGNYVVKVCDQPLIIEGEKATSYLITYDNSPVSIEIMVDKEKNCKNYIVISDGLAVMYTCNGVYFGVNKIDEKYSKEGYVTDVTNLDKLNYFHQKLIVHGQMDEVPATSMIACYYPFLNTKK